MTKLHQAAIAYADLGYPIIPCALGSKPPVTQAGIYDATTDIDLIDSWWSDGEYNIGLVTDGLVAIDIDGPDNAWLRNDPDKLLELSQAPMAKTPRGGSHYLFRQPEGSEIKCSAGRIAPNVDVRANGGYIVVAPSIVRGVGHYEWRNGDLDIPRHDLPYPPAWLLEALDESSSSDWSLLESGNPIPQGVRHKTICSMVGMQRRFGLTPSEMAPMIHNLNLRCVPPLPRSEVDRIIQDSAKWSPDPISVAMVENHFDQDLLIEPRVVTTQDPGAFPKHLLNPGGILGDIMKYLQVTSFREQPILDLAGALALMSVAIGQKYMDPIGCRANLFILGVCSSGGGKENARRQIAEILETCDMEDRIGPEDIKSDTGLLKCVETRPRGVILMLDELAYLLKTMADPTKAYLFNIAQVLMKLYNSSSGKFRGSAYADAERTKVIDQPYLVIYGTTIPRAFYENIEREKLENGFMGRLIVFESGDVPKAKTPRRMEIPPSIIEALTFIRDIRHSGDLSSLWKQPFEVPYTQRAIEIVEGFESEADERGRTSTDDSARVIWFRTAEKVRKIALIHAVALNPKEPVVGEESAQYACDLGRYLTERMLYQASVWVSESSHEKNRNLIVRIIEKNGRSISKMMLARKTPFMRWKDRAEIVYSLKETGHLTEEKEPTNGADRTVYKLL